MRILVDTNLLTRAADPSHIQYSVAKEAITLISRRGDAACLVPQNLYEFWVVCTRPVCDNGLGMNATMVLHRLAELKQAFEVLDETPAFRSAWESLVSRYSVQGKSAHDARLVAAMKVHGLNTILTFNKQHFLRYEEITIVEPSALSAK